MTIIDIIFGFNYEIGRTCFLIPISRSTPFIDISNEFLGSSTLDRSHQTRSNDSGFKKLVKKDGSKMLTKDFHQEITIMGILHFSILYDKEHIHIRTYIIGTVRPRGGNERAGAGRVSGFWGGREGVIAKTAQKWQCKFRFYAFFYYYFSGQGV